MRVRLRTRSGCRQGELCRQPAAERHASDVRRVVRSEAQPVEDVEDVVDGVLDVVDLARALPSRRSPGASGPHLEGVIRRQKPEESATASAPSRPRTSGGTPRAVLAGSPPRVSWMSPTAVANGPVSSGRRLGVLTPGLPPMTRGVRCRESAPAAPARPRSRTARDCGGCRRPGACPSWNRPSRLPTPSRSTFSAEQLGHRLGRAHDGVLTLDHLVPRLEVQGERADALHDVLHRSHRGVAGRRDVDAGQQALDEVPEVLLETPAGLGVGLGDEDRHEPAQLRGDRPRSPPFWHASRIRANMRSNTLMWKYGMPM